MSEPFPPTALRRRHAQTVRDSTSIYKMDYVIVIKNFLNLEGHQNPIIGSKVTTILLILPTGGASSGRVCACSLRSRPVFPPDTLNYTSNIQKPFSPLVPILVIHFASLCFQPYSHWPDHFWEILTFQEKNIYYSIFRCFKQK